MDDGLWLSSGRPRGRSVSPFREFCEFRVKKINRTQQISPSNYVSHKIHKIHKRIHRFSRMSHPAGQHGPASALFMKIRGSFMAIRVKEKIFAQYHRE